MKTASYWSGLLLALTTTIAIVSAAFGVKANSIESQSKTPTSGVVAKDTPVPVYAAGTLSYRQSGALKNDKVVEMTERVQMFRYECHDLIPGMQHRPIIEVMAAVAPSIVWEQDFHRAVALYGGLGTGEDVAMKDVVNQNDIREGAATYLGQYQELMCLLVRPMSLNDMLTRPSLGTVRTLNELLKKEESLFDIKIQTIRVVLPEALKQSLALKAATQPQQRSRSSK